MADLSESLDSLARLLLVVLGFGLLIVIHELGHFLAARWAGIRVLAFAVGMGPAVVSWRKGLGWRRGSSEREYDALTRARAAGATTAEGARATHHAVSPTEYRLNVLPFGGYVKMLGQDDVNPAAVSSAPDSFQSCPVWKRMIVISAGVAANVATAALIFVFVFRVGLASEPPVIGEVMPGSAAAAAVALNAEDLGVTEPGLRPGDRVTVLNGERPESFSDLTLATAMSHRDEPIGLTVERAGAHEPLRFSIKPAVGGAGLLELGVEPARSARVFNGKNERARAEIAADLPKLGLPGVRPGMTLVRAGSVDPVRGAEDLSSAARASGGRPFQAEFADSAGRVAVTLTPRAEFQTVAVHRADGTIALQPHLLGLTPVLRVQTATEEGAAQGLADGDLFVRIGTVEYPSFAAGTAELHAAKGRSISAVVARARPDGKAEEVPLTLKVNGKGTVGFIAGDASEVGTLLALPPARDAGADGTPVKTPALGLVTMPGTRVVAVGDVPVRDFTAVREAMREQTRAALERGDADAAVTLTLHPPALPSAQRPDETVTLGLKRADLEALHALNWRSPADPGAFELEETTLKAASAAEAVRMGVRETKRVMMSVYTTFARLFERTVKIEHLKGPVGIAHLGTRVADRGIIWLLFFMGLISANLAVINFLPLPIVDGGQFLFLVFEAIRGKPVPIPVQNAATIVGLVLIGSVFLLVTFNDVVGLFGR